MTKKAYELVKFWICQRSLLGELGNVFNFLLEAASRPRCLAHQANFSGSFKISPINKKTNLHFFRHLLSNLNWFSELTQGLYPFEDKALESIDFFKILQHTKIKYELDFDYSLFNDYLDKIETLKYLTNKVNQVLRRDSVGLTDLMLDSESIPNPFDLMEDIGNDPY